MLPVRDELCSGGIVSGGSTLTMQVARILDGGDTRSAGGKLRQMARALQLEARLSKDQILQLYLERAPFGGTIAHVITFAAVRRTMAVGALWSAGVRDFDLSDPRPRIDVTYVSAQSTASAVAHSAVLVRSSVFAPASRSAPAAANGTRLSASWWRRTRPPRG